MADTVTTVFSFTKIENFASTNTWGTKTNANWDALDAALAAVQTTANAAAPASRTLGSAGGTISGLGTLAADKPNIEVVPNMTNQKVAVYVGGSLIGTRKAVNLVSGAFVTIIGADNAGSDRVDVTVTGADSETSITESLSTIGKTSSIARTGFDGAFITTTPAVKATVPAGRVCIKPLVIVTNNSATDEGVACWFVPNGGAAANANKVWSSGYLRVPAGRSIVIGEDQMHILGAGATIVLQSETHSTTLSCRISMETVPDSNTAYIEGTPTVLTTSLVTFRTVAAKTSRVAWIAHNYSAAYAGLTVAYRPAAAGADSAAYNVGFYNGVALLEPGQTVVYSYPDVLNAGDLIRASASAVSSIAFRLSVLELA